RVACAIHPSRLSKVVPGPPASNDCQGGSVSPPPVVVVDPLVPWPPAPVTDVDAPPVATEDVVPVLWVEDVPTAPCVDAPPAPWVDEVAPVAEEDEVPLVPCPEEPLLVCGGPTSPGPHAATPSANHVARMGLMTIGIRL